MRLSALLVALVVWIGLGCGGAPPNLDDGTAPVLQSTSPAQGATNVLVTAQIRFSFDEAIDDGFQATFDLGGTPIVATAQLENSRTIVVEPPVIGAVPATATVRLSGVKDRFGNEMAQQPSVTFTYPDWIPMGAQVTTSTAPYLVAGTPGPIVAWSGASEVNVRRWSSGAWETLAAPGNGTGLSLTVDPGGAPVVSFLAAGVPRPMRYAGGAWTLVGSALPTQSVDHSIGTAVAYDGAALQIAVGNDYYQTCTYTGSSGTCNTTYAKLSLYRFDGTAWQQRSTVNLTSDYAAVGAIAGIAGGANGLLIGWDSDVRMIVGTGSLSNQGSPGSSLAGVGFYQGAPIALASGKVRTRATGSWADLGLTANVVSLFAGNDAPPVIATRKTSTTPGAPAGSYDVQVLEWNSASQQWTLLGRTLTGTDAETTTPRVTVGPDGEVYRMVNGVVSRLNR